MEKKRLVVIIVVLILVIGGTGIISFYLRLRKTGAASFQIWKTYVNDTFGITLKYPDHWFGPEVSEYGDGFFFEVGSDAVYPYGTDILSRTKQNDFFITIQYARKPDGMTVEQYVESQSWLNGYLSMYSMKDGESVIGPSVTVTKVRGFRIGEYNGVEIITRTTKGAGTEKEHNRQAFLIDENDNTFRIVGSPSPIFLYSFRHMISSMVP